MIPQPIMVPPQYFYDWYDPQNNPWAYYYPNFDPSYFGYAPPSQSRSQTPQPQPMPQNYSQNNASATPQQAPQYPPYFYPYPFVFMPPFMGFRPISSSRETTPCFSEAERYPTTPSFSEDRNRRAVSCTPTCCQHAKSFPIDDNHNKFHTVEEPIISRTVPSESIHLSPPKPPDEEVMMSSSDVENEEAENFPLACDLQRRQSLKSIPSVSNMHVFANENDECDLEEIQAKPIVTEDDDRSEASEDTTEVEEEISQDTETVDIHFPHQLSVIYEENESAANERRSSVCSRSSTLSDCSTTLMEEDIMSSDDNDDEKGEDENSSSVTVRLPLKFSFTRSDDNKVNTTLTVGESEREIHELTPENEIHRSPTPPVLLNNRSHSLSTNSSANDVSVTFSLKSKSKTPERLINPSLSVICDNINEEPDRECSVNISLPRKQKSIDEIMKARRNSGSHKDETTSDNSGENKNYIDTSLFTSQDALEEIKKGMLDITSSLFSRICTLRKSALNIPENARNRSGSISQIEKSLSDIDSIESDSENDSSFSFNDCKIETNKINEEIVLELDSQPQEPVKEEIDFWSQISDSNKAQEDKNTLSKTSTHSSRYWFDEDSYAEPEPIPKEAKDEDGFSKYEINDVTTSVSFVSLNEQDIPENNESENEEQEEEIDYWKDYDPDDSYKAKANKFLESRFEEEKSEEKYHEMHTDNNLSTIDEDPTEFEEFDQKIEMENVVSKDDKSVYDDDSDTESCKDFHVDLKSTVKSEQALDVKNDLTNQEIESDEEWTEEEVEVTDDEEIEIKPTQIKLNAHPIVLVKIDHRPVKFITIKTETVEIQTPVLNDASIFEDDEEEEDEEEESEKSEESEKELPVEKSRENSFSGISKGKSLVNVNSFIISENNRENINAIQEKFVSKMSSDEEEEEEDEEALPIISSNDKSFVTHSNDDCHLLIDNHDQVLLPPLSQVQSIDSKSNMTSESGISFEQNENYPDSEDGYEEDSDEEILNENEKTIIRESPEKDMAVEDGNEIKVNVKGKISMYERACSEEKVIEKSFKDTPRVASKYSFRHRESSEPPRESFISVPKRAASEAKEIFTKNQKIIDLIHQRKSLPPTSVSEEENVDANEKRENYKRYGHSKKSCPLVRSIDESGEEDSGFSCKQFSENETDSEVFPELRKLSRYERASTHSRLFKLLQGDEEIPEKDEETEPAVVVTKIPYKSKKIVHNVSVTRRQNPQAALQAETMEERRQRLCLPLTHQSSSGAESMSSSTTPSPTPINEKLVQELVQSLLIQKRGRQFRNLPVEKLHAAAVKILQEDIESNGTLSSADESTVPTVDSTPALTPQEFRNNSSYSEYYDSWNNANATIDEITPDLIQSKAFKNLQEQQYSSANKKLWSVRCPRILSSKSINKDLARLSEVRESESPEPNHSRSPSLRSYSTEPPMSGEKRINSSQERQMAYNT